MRRALVFLLAFVFVATAVLAACTNNNAGGGDTSAPPPASTDNGSATTDSGSGVVTGYQKDMQKDVITFKGVRPVTGANAIFEQVAFGPMYRMWAEQINDQGGVYIKSLDRRVPVDIQVYDDGSDITKTTQLFEQILASDKPDMVIPPEGTASLFACAPIAQKYNYLLMCAEGGAVSLAQYLPEYKNTFLTLNCTEYCVNALIKLFQEEGVKSVYLVYVDDLYGAEHRSILEPGLKAAGIDLLGMESIPLEGDFNPDNVVNNAMRSGCDAFCAFVYPPGFIPITMSAVKLDYNPNMFVVGSGGCFDVFGQMVFDDLTNKKVDGIITWGAWNEKSNQNGVRAKEFSDLFKNYYINRGEFWKNADGSLNPNGFVFQDWFGHLPYYCIPQIWEQALGQAGELMDDGRINNQTLVDYIANNTFDTYMNPQLKFVNNVIPEDMYAGFLGQWQNGTFEVVDNDARRTADPWYPKPAWQK